MTEEAAAGEGHTGLRLRQYIIAQDAAENEMLRIASVICLSSEDESSSRSTLP